MVMGNNQIFTLDEICTFYRDNYKLKANCEVSVKVECLFGFFMFICKYFDSFEEGLLQDNYEWVFVQIYGFFEKGLIAKNSKEFSKVNQIIDDLNAKKMISKSFILTQLSDLI